MYSTTARSEHAIMYSMHSFKFILVHIQYDITCSFNIQLSFIIHNSFFGLPTTRYVVCHACPSLTRATHRYWNRRLSPRSSRRQYCIPDEVIQLIMLISLRLMLTSLRLRYVALLYCTVVSRGHVVLASNTLHNPSENLHEYIDTLMFVGLAGERPDALFFLNLRRIALLLP